MTKYHVYTMSREKPIIIQAVKHELCKPKLEERIFYDDKMQVVARIKEQFIIGIVEER